MQRSYGEFGGNKEKDRRRKKLKRDQDHRKGKRHEKGSRKGRKRQWQ